MALRERVRDRIEPSEVRERIDRVFSRKVLGAALVASAAWKFVAVVVEELVPEPVLFEGGIWFAVFFLTVVVFVWWERIERAADFDAPDLPDPDDD